MVEIWFQRVRGAVLDLAPGLDCFWGAGHFAGACCCLRVSVGIFTAHRKRRI